MDINFRSCIHIFMYIYICKQLNSWHAESHTHLALTNTWTNFNLKYLISILLLFRSTGNYIYVYICLCMYVYACMSDRNQCVLHADALEISVNGITYNSNWPHQIIVFENICIAFDNLAGGRRCTVASWQTNFPL